ncbi:uncharacterized protein BDFB_004854, partial [Asbolus verrucosus]
MSELSLPAKIRLVFANITVEPMLVCFILPSVMANLATQNLNLDKACRVNLRLEGRVCDGLALRDASYNRSDEVQVQKLVATMNAWKNVVQSFVPCLLLLFLGSWSDRHKRRKPCFLGPIVGETLACLGLLVCTHFYHELPAEFNAFFEAVPPSLTGGWFAMFMAVFSYVAGVTSLQTRTLRIGAVNIFANLSFTVGNALSGILYRHVGFYGIYSIAVLFYLAGFVYGVFAIKEIPQEGAECAEKGFFRDFFDVSHVADTFKVAFKKGERNRKARICTIMILCVVIVGPMHGEMSVLYLFLRYKFGWNEVDYSIYSTFYVITHMFGTLFSLVLFTKILKIDDAALGMLSSASRILASLVYAFAPNSFVFYVVSIGALIEILNGTTFIAMRSIMSKLVPSNELGKINSLFGLSEALVPIIYGPLYSIIYKLTINLLPGAFFIAGAILTAPSLFIFWLVLLIEAGLQSILTEEEPEAPKPVSLCHKAKLILTNITVEPILICYVLPSVMASLATQNLNLEKACRVNLHRDAALCDALTIRNDSAYNKTDEEEVQKLVATMNAWKNVVQSLVPSMLLLFLGSWSDRHQRRKPCIVTPIAGEICTCLGFLLCTYFFTQLPMEFNAFFESVPPSLTGGWFAMFMGVYSYVSSVSSVEMRTLRIGAVNLFSNVSVTIGIALSGILYNEIGFYGVFSLALVMYFTGLVYAVTRIKEAPKKDEIAKEPQKKVNPIRDFFDLKHIRDTFKVAFKEGARNRKRRICVIMVLVMVVIGPMHGEMNVMYLFVRYKFKWNSIDYSIYSTFHFVVHVCGTVFSLMFFTKFLKLDDAVLGMISSTSKICACLVYTFAPTSWVFYCGAVVEALNGTSFIAMRSIMSKLVPADELGKINSLFGVSEALMPLIYGPMYSMTYKATINVLPGAFYLLGGILTTPAVFIFFWLYREHQRDKKEEEKEEAQKVNLLQK